MIESGKKYQVSFDVEVQRKNGTKNSTNHIFELEIEDVKDSVLIKTKSKFNSGNNNYYTKVKVAYDTYCKKCKFYTICNKVTDSSKTYEYNYNLFVIYLLNSEYECFYKSKQIDYAKNINIKEIE